MEVLKLKGREGNEVERVVGEPSGISPFGCEHADDQVRLMAFATITTLSQLHSVVYKASTIEGTNMHIRTCVPFCLNNYKSQPNSTTIP